LKSHIRTKEHSDNISRAKKGKKNEKVSIALKGRIGNNKGKILKTYECVHCGIKTSGGNITRWSGNNCKSKENNYVKIIRC